MIVTAAKMKAFRGAVDAALNRVLPDTVAVVLYPDKRALEDVPIGTEVRYALMSTSASEFAERERGGRVPIVRLQAAARPDRPVAWLGWFEQWQKTSIDNFALLNASATFFWGIASRPAKQQVLRAEWDSDDVASAGAAQPHWQFDPTYRWFDASEALASLVEPPPTLSDLVEELEEPALVEYTPALEHELSISRMHLSMAGWTNAPKQKYPICWRRSLPTAATEFAAWLELTVMHASDQFRLVSQKAVA
jgi:hypothetical protein